MPGYADDRTEPATPRRRQDARTRGQVARSTDLTAAVLLLTGFLALYLLGGRLFLHWLAMVAAALSADPVVPVRELTPYARAAAAEAVAKTMPFLIIVFFVMLSALVAQIGPLFTWHPVVPSLSRINPLLGLKRLFSVRSVMLAAVNFGKLLVVSAVACLSLAGSAAAILYASAVGSHDVIRLGSSLTFGLGLRLGVALAVLAVLDLAWQRYRHERDLRMTREEVKDELRRMEGDPLIKRRRREIQLQLAMRRLRKQVPHADVVVTNPTHVAVALRYDADTMVAPKVVAKGADYLALRIRQLAREFGVPIVQRPPLARALYESVDVGGFVPERLYKAIAEILAYVYELTGKTPRARRSAPKRPR